MEKENILGTEKIKKLIMKFSIPCIISMLVNSLYNMVDQIFIGHGVGMLGNGATNVVFPISVIALAFSLMFGDGSSAFLSLKLGEKKKEEAAKGVGNGITLSVIFSVIFTIITLVFLPELLNLFGCTSALKEYATNYGRIIVIGLPFVIIGTTLNSIIRADGNPKYSMISMVTGAVLNIILDPIFIFIFNMGVEGAAYATIISQFITFLFNIIYIKKFKTINITKEIFKPNYKISKKIITLGISSFITQMSIVIVIAIQNNLLGKYGKLTQYGSEIPITVLGIVMKISQIINSIIIGLSVGAQPIFGYNYGAKKYYRVKQTLKIVISSSLIITTIAFILFQTIPDKLILIFGSGNDNYIKFACLTFRIYLMLIICNGIQISSGIFFQAIGKSTKSAILSLSRQIIFLLPSMLILSHFFGLMGILYSGPLADGVAFIISGILLIIETKNLNKNTSLTTTKQEDQKITPNLKEHIVITLGREYGSGGRYIGSKVAEELGIKLYDKNFISRVREETGLEEKYIEENEQKRKPLEILNSYYGNLTNSDELFLIETKIIKKLAKEESCVIVGRCADYILKNEKNVYKIFIYNSLENKIKRATKYYGLKKNNAQKEINKINKLRSNHYKHYTGKKWDDPENYDLCINSDALGVERVAKLICDIIKENTK